VSERLSPSTPEPPLDPLDQLLHEHLAQQLNPHVGRAAQAFLRDTAARDAAPTASTRTMRLWWAAPLLAVAAAIAIFAGPLLRFTAPRSVDAPSVASGIAPSVARPQLPVTPDNPTSDSPAADAVLASYDPQDVEGVVRWASRDEGMVWLDDETPARKIRRQRWETVEWTDPRDSSRIAVSVPREEIVLVSFPKL